MNGLEIVRSAKALHDKGVAICREDNLIGLGREKDKEQRGRMKVMRSHVTCLRV